MLIERKEPKTNQRVYFRHELVRPATLQIGGANYLFGNTADLSNGGASVIIDDVIDPVTSEFSGKLWLSTEQDFEKRVSSSNSYNIPCQILRIFEQKIAIVFDDAMYASAQLNAVLLAHI
jgi:hypothetical protein